MTLRELKTFDGRDGKPAYIAYKGKVYDVTQSALWKEGDHEGMHRAGRDLTEMLAGAPHGDEVFEGFPVVGTLEEEVQAPSKAVPSARATTEASAPPDAQKARRRYWQALYRKYHPHPMTVHFPIAFYLFAAFMDLLFLFDPKTLFASAVFYTFFAATFMGGVAMVPGIISWKINYGLSLRRPFVVKLILATLMLLAGIVAVVLHLEDPGIVYRADPRGVIYHAVVLLSGVGVVVVGYYGGKITWSEPQESEALKQAAQAENQPEAARPQETAAAGPQTLAAAGRYDVPFMAAADDPAVTLPGHAPIGASGAGTRSIAVLIGGAAGLGIDTLEKVLSEAFMKSGFFVYSSKEFMSRVRGGSNTTLIRIADAPLEAPCWEVDLFIALDALALEHAAPRLTEKTVILADESFAGAAPEAIAVALQSRARELGDVRYGNTYAAGLVYGLFGLEPSALRESVAERFAEDPGNLQAAESGVEAGRGLEHPPLPPLPEAAPDRVKALHLMDGTTASGFGFLSGGCNFVGAYPMSPSTGVLTFMASMSKYFDIAVEQSEDEIASIHLVLGAWYAGARAMTTTSGGGFALMGEGISLSGITETPAVFYLAQRPGPATGMPTRSEQGDLNLAMHSGHGHFPRIVLAPGSLRECIDLGYLAFELADRWQLPVIFLSDQYLADTMAMIGDVDFSAYEPRRYVVPTDESYRRYVLTPGGVSPRGIPAFGDGLVLADGHEHEERGQITEDFRVREQMIAKRGRKEQRVVAEALAPELLGEGSIAVIGWGSTRGAIAEALLRLDDDRLAQVHFFWVHPLNPEHLEMLKAFDCRIVVENNADGAFADVLSMHGVHIDRKILQSNGFAFFADQLTDRLDAVLKELT